MEKVYSWIGPRQRVAGLTIAQADDATPFAKAVGYQARDEDIFQVASLKTGSTWIRQIITLLINGDSIPEGITHKAIRKLSPLLEGEPDSLANMKRPNVIKTHLPFTHIPWNPKAKYILVVRNPKDTLVSFYHHVKAFIEPVDPNADFTISDFVPFFIKSGLYGGPYFDFLLQWLPVMSRANVQLVVYEKMMTNRREEIHKLARFLNMELTEELLDFVMERSTKEYTRKLIDEAKMGRNGQSFVRKAEIGDWRNHLTNEDSQLIEKEMDERFKGTLFEHLWDDFDVRDSLP
ncbi:Amine sulfotransferase [Halotydeus destructor]|nr:Amine sulfotransferase [Halotydeus destructor]